MTGTIKRLTEKGFGFIAREGEAKDLFFHSNDLSGVSFDELKVGEFKAFFGYGFGYHHGGYGYPMMGGYDQDGSWGPPMMNGGYSAPQAPAPTR